jgi:hypothetical protein
MLSSQYKEEIGRKRYIVKEIIDVLIPYGRQIDTNTGTITASPCGM